MDTYAKSQGGSAFSAATLVIFGLFVAITPFIRLAAGINEHGSAAPTCVLTEVDIEAPYANNGDAPEIFADGAVLIDGRSREILYSKECDKRLPMASTTKIMTALVAAETLSGDEYVKVPKECAGIEGSSIYLEVGETVSGKTLLYGIMLDSGNDAATALAILSCGSVERFAEKMNERAKSLGLTSTNFTNPHGLPDDNHYTTAYELAVIASEAMKNDKVAEAVSSVNAVAGGENGEKRRYFTNHNKLLRLYDGACGVKTGFTRAAGRCLVSAAKRDGTLLIAVTLGCPDDWNAHISMLDYGFRNFKSVMISPEEGIDLSPFGIPCEKSGEVWRTLPRDSSPALSYRVTYSHGETSLYVAEK